MLHRVLQTYIDKSDYFHRFMAKGFDQQIAEDLYQEFYLYLDRPVILNKITEQDGEGRIVQFIKGCFKWFKMQFFRDKMNGPNHAGAQGFTELEDSMVEIEYIAYEDLELDHDMKALIIKLKEKFPGFTGLARMVDESLAGKEYVRADRAKDHAVIKHLKVNHSNKLVEFKEKYGEGYL